MVRNSGNCNFINKNETILGDRRNCYPAYGIEVLPISVQVLTSRDYTWIH